MKSSEKIPGNGYLLLSGGQDSFVCLLWSLATFEHVEAISINYGQSHHPELDYAARIAETFGVSHTIYHIGDFLKNIADSSLLVDGNHNGQHLSAGHLPASFVPNRNGLFLTIVSNHAFRKEKGEIHLVTGVCETDYSGYPDCRQAYIQAKEKELALGLDRPVTIHTPLMWKNKAQVFDMAYCYGRLKELRELTLTCYNGNETLHEWGRGCGQCPSCTLRKKGYEQFMSSYYKG